MAIKLNEFIDRFKAMEKVANETLAANPEALVGVDSMPGSEHDQKVPADAKKPDKEVAQGQPAGATTSEGAVNGGDAKPLNEGKLEMDEPLLNPEQKPLVTDDALTAKTANAQLVGLVSDLLADLNGTQKQAQCCSEHAATAKAESKKEEKKDEPKEEKKASKENAITLDDQTIAKLAAAQVAFANGRKAAEAVIKQASSNDLAAEARALVKAACVKAAQESGLDPAAAEAAADNAMLAAGVAPEAAAADAGAAAADAGAAEAAADDAKAAEIPEDVTEEELATALVDLVSSGELDPDTAKALVEEIAGGEAGPTEDQAAEIIAQGLESGEITPEQAQEIAAAVEGGAAEEAGAATEAGAEAAAADEEAQGAADAADAIQDAQDEAQGAADAEAAMKAAAAQIRQNAIQKVASHIVEKRAAAKAPAPGSKVMAKVASILKDKVSQKKAAAKPADEAEAKYIAGFKKKAEEMGIDPSSLAKYIVERQAK